MIAICLQFLFSLVMIWDAWHRRCPLHWFLIIMLPFGELFYFFKLYMRDPAFRCHRCGDLKIAKNLERAKRDFAMTPSLDRRRRLAAALLETDSPVVALEYLQPFAAQHKQDYTFQLLLGKALLRTGDFPSTIGVLEPLVKDSPKAMEFEAWLYLVAAHVKLGNEARALILMDELQVQYPRLKHQLTLAAYFAKYGRLEDARNLLRQALRTYAGFPPFLHWEHAFWAREAKRMLRQKIPSP